MSLPRILIQPAPAAIAVSIPSRDSVSLPQDRPNQERRHGVVSIPSRDSVSLPPFEVRDRAFILFVSIPSRDSVSLPRI